VRKRTGSADLARSGVPLDDITGLALLVKPANAKAILRFFLDRAGGTPKDSIYGLACLLRAIARYWVRNHGDLPNLDVLCRALAHETVKKRGMKERNRRLRQFDDERNLSRLLHFPTKLFQLGRKGTRGKYANTYAMYGVATEILLRSARGQPEGRDQHYPSRRPEEGADYAMAARRRRKERI
jgi:hypothetical protein